MDVDPGSPTLVDPLRERRLQLAALRDGLIMGGIFAACIMGGSPRVGADAKVWPMVLLGVLLVAASFSGRAAARSGGVHAPAAARGWGWFQVVAAVVLLAPVAIADGATCRAGVLRARKARRTLLIRNCRENFAVPHFCSMIEGARIVALGSR